MNPPLFNSYIANINKKVKKREIGYIALGGYDGRFSNKRKLELCTKTKIVVINNKRYEKI